MVGVQQKTRVLWVVALAQALIAVDSTVMNVALPTLQAALGFDETVSHWVITSYALAFGAFLLPGARVVARIGARRGLVWGGILFGMASLVGGLAGSFELLILSRGAQGVAAALIAPAALTALGESFPSGVERVRAFGVYGAVGVAGMAAGLFLGGPLAQFLGWRSALLLLAVLAGVLVAGAVASVPRSVQSRSRLLPARSVILSVSGVFLVVLSLAILETAGVTAGLPLLALGLLLLTVLTWSERRERDPLIPRVVFANRDRVASLAVLGLGTAGLFAVFLFVVYYLQGPLGLDPVGSSLAILPFPIVAALGSVFLAPVLGRILGPRLTLVAAAALAAAGMGWIAVEAADANSVVALMPGIVLTAAGMGAIFAIAPDRATLGLDDGDRAAGSSLVHAVQQIGGAAGLALLSLLVSVSGVGSSPAVYQLVFTATAVIFLVAAAAGAAAAWLPLKRNQLRASAPEQKA